MASKFQSKFWHYRLSNAVDQSTNRPLWIETRCDLELSKLQSEVIRPWKSGQPFSVNGTKFTSSSSNIQIIWTPKVSSEYMNADRIVDIGKAFTRSATLGDMFLNAVQEISKTDKMACQRVFMVSEKTDYTNELLMDTEQEGTHPAPKSLTPRSAAKPNERLVPAKVFISYSHKDKKFKEELETHMKPRIRNGVSCWSDKQIQPGSKWMNEIADALAHATVAVLLVSPSFLSSEFIHNHELNPLLERARTGSIHVLWVLVRSCAYKETSIKNYQAAYSIEKPLAEMKAERDRAWDAICDRIKEIATSDRRSDTGSASFFR